MRKNKFVAGITALAMVVTFSCGITVNAAGRSLGVNKKNSSLLKSGMSSVMQSATEELKQDDISALDANIMERQYNGVQNSVSEASAVSLEHNKIDTSTSSKDNPKNKRIESNNIVQKEIDETNTSTNTDPNNAYLVANDNVVQGAIETSGETRWYAFTLNEKSKVTILLQMVEALDADLYMFSLNTETYQLELVGGSATEGVGITEYCNSTLEAGTYFFAVGGYEGTGNFTFAYYQSTADAGNEINDSVQTASNVSFNTSISGVIDNPNDVDYYKLTVTNAALFKYSISTTNNYNLAYATKSGTNSAIYAVDGNMVRVMPGTYYFGVYSPNGSYSASSTYVVNFEKISDLANDSSASLMATNKSAGIVFQSDPTGSKCYVNGNPIDISYSYVWSSSNSAGYQSYDISLKQKSDVFAYLGTGVYEPEVAYYLYSTRPALNVSSRPVLQLTYYSNNPFYNIYCSCSGAYAANRLWENLNAVTVIIDPATGKMIDILEFNYYYQYAVGSNSITCTYPYSGMTFYYNRA